MRALGLITSAVALHGCARSRPPESGGRAVIDRDREVVARISFEGNSGRWQGRADYNLRGAIDQGQNPPLVWVKPRPRRVYLDEDTLRRDAWRLETWYAHRGYFDARFVGWDVSRVREPRAVLFWKLPARVKIVGHIDARSPYPIREVSWRGLDAIKVTLGRLERSAALQPGEVFQLTDLQDTVAVAADHLANQGYPAVEITHRVDVWPSEDAVDVSLDVELGPLCDFGETVLSGEFTVPKALIHAELDELLVPGERYSSRTLARAQRRLFALGAFSVVSITPDVAKIKDDRVPIRVQLTQSKARQIRAGFGGDFESGRREVHASVEFEQVNLFDRLVRLRPATQPGVTWLTADFDDSETLTEELVTEAVPTVAFDTELSVPVGLKIPVLPSQRWRIGTDFRFELGVEEGYRFASPEFSPSLTGRLGRNVTVTRAYHLRYFDYLELELDCSAFSSAALGLDCSDPYLLSYLSQQVTVDSRDDPINPRKGMYGIYEVAESSEVLGSQYNFLRFTVDQRGYVPLRGLRNFLPVLLRSSVGLRVGTGVIFPYGDDPELARVPYAERLTLGGSTSVRGWTIDHLGPYICDPDEAETDCESALGVSQPDDEILPIGGLASLYGASELRFYLPRWEALGIVLFTDVGMVWEEPGDLRLRQLQRSIGLGGRYRTELGPLRIDVARRMGAEPMFAQEDRWAFHFSLSEAF